MKFHRKSLSARHRAQGAACYKPQQFDTMDDRRSRFVGRMSATALSPAIRRSASTLGHSGDTPGILSRPPMSDGAVFHWSRHVEPPARAWTGHAVTPYRGDRQDRCLPAAAAPRRKCPKKSRTPARWAPGRIQMSAADRHMPSKKRGGIVLQQTVSPMTFCVRITGQWPRSGMWSLNLVGQRRTKSRGQRRCETRRGQIGRSLGKNA